MFSFNQKQPLDKICNYFGVKLGLYFAWLGFYTRSLALPAMLGLVFWLNLNQNETHDAIFFLVLCLFNLVWSICFTDLWKQKCAEFSYKWGTLDLEENLLQDPRPLFKGVYKPSPVTNKLEPHYSEWKRVCFRFFVTLPCLIASIAVTVGIMLTVFSFQGYIANKVEAELLPGKLRYFDTTYSLFNRNNFCFKSFLWFDFLFTKNALCKHHWRSEHILQNTLHLAKR